MQQRQFEPITINPYIKEEEDTTWKRQEDGNEP